MIKFVSLITDATNNLYDLKNETPRHIIRRIYQLRRYIHKRMMYLLPTTYNVKLAALWGKGRSHGSRIFDRCAAIEWFNANNDQTKQVDELKAWAAGTPIFMRILGDWLEWAHGERVRMPKIEDYGIEKNCQSAPIVIN